RGRAPLPVLQGDHGGQGEAGRRARCRRPRSVVRRGGLGRRPPGDHRRRPRRRAAGGRDRRGRGRRPRTHHPVPRAAEGDLAMAVGTTWVFAEAFEGKVLSSTLELLTKARELGGTVEAFYAGGDAESVAPELGTFGAAKVYATGDLGSVLMGAPAAAAMAAQIEAGGAPDLL